MKTYYHITNAGVIHAVASPKVETSTDDNIYQLLLLYLLKQNINGAILFSDILEYFYNNKSLAFKTISKLISLQLVDITETQNDKNEIHSRHFLNDQCKDNDYILSDLNGLTISYCGFEQQQAVMICAVAYDYINASKRSRYETKVDSPLSIKTSWNNTDIIINQLYLESFPCLLITRDTDFLDKKEFINLASYLCNRYNYE